MTEQAIQSDPLFNEVHRLATMCLEGNATADTFEVLEKLVADHPEAIDVYVEYLRDSICLRYVVSPSEQERPEFPEPILDKAVTSSSDALATLSQTSSSAVPKFLFAAYEGSVGYVSSGWPTAYLLATLILGIGIAIASMTYVSPPSQVVDQVNSIPSHPTAQALVVGRITGMADCQWSDPSSPNADTRSLKSTVSLGDRLAIRSGLLEITYSTGGRVILQGPVIYEIDSVAGGYLSIGKLTARLEKRTEYEARMSDRVPSVSPSVQPPPLFTINTPTATVIDLGTEFGVEVNEQGVTETQVFVGSIKVARIGETAEKNEKLLHAGDAVRVDRQDVSPLVIPAKSQRFIRTLSSAKANQSADYAKLVLSMKPIAYYRMEPSEDSDRRSVLIDSSSDVHHGALYFNPAYVGEPYTTGRFGQALRLRGSMAGDYANVPNCPNANKDRLTVSVWAYLLSRPGIGNRGIIAASYDTDPTLKPEDGASMLQFRIGIDGESEKFLEGAVRQRDGKKAVLASEKSEFPIGAWQHLAMVADGTFLHLYRNGVEVASAPCIGVMPGPAFSKLAIGTSMRNDGTAPPEKLLCHWPGRLDELAIFNRALSPAEIRNLYIGEFNQ